MGIRGLEHLFLILFLQKLPKIVSDLFYRDYLNDFRWFLFVGWFHFDWVGSDQLGFRPCLLRSTLTFFRVRLSWKRSLLGRLLLLFLIRFMFNYNPNSSDSLRSRALWFGSLFLMATFLLSTWLTVLNVYYLVSCVLKRGHDWPGNCVLQRVLRLSLRGFLLFDQWRLMRGWITGWSSKIAVFMSS